MTIDRDELMKAASRINNSTGERLIKIWPNGDISTYPAWLSLDGRLRIYLRGLFIEGRICNDSTELEYLMEDLRTLGLFDGEPGL